MSSPTDQDTKKQEDKKKYLWPMIYVFGTFAFLFGMIAFRILTQWDLLMRNPMVYGWDFFLDPIPVSRYGAAPAPLSRGMLKKSTPRAPLERIVDFGGTKWRLIVVTWV